MQLRFVPSESTDRHTSRRSKGYLEDSRLPGRVLLRQALGLPGEHAGRCRVGSGMTQFGRALAELNIEILCANSSQAKGRVETGEPHAAGPAGEGAAAGG